MTSALLAVSASRAYPILARLRRQVTTTPSAAPISLSPGRRWLRFQNPFFAEEVREIIIEPGEDLLVQVQLDPIPTDASVDEAESGSLEESEP